MVPHHDVDRVKKKTWVNDLPQGLGPWWELSFCDDFFKPVFSHSSISSASIHRGWAGATGCYRGKMQMLTKA